ncbi:MAG: IS110 family transposase [Actinobacteria bacterium]|nr:IS110 family transposase [Actinomycetota bacterium]
MIVIGVDPHKQTHTAAAVNATLGELRGERTVKARGQGHEQLLAWARSLGRERLWALEDCRHVSVSLERFLLASGERVVRVPPKLMAGARRQGRERGKSDAIDALAVARAALREPELPVGRLAGPEREIRLLTDHRDDLVQERTRIPQRLRWHLHELYPELELPAGCLERRIWLERIGRRLARAPQTRQVVIARELVGRCRELTRRAEELHGEIAALVRTQAPALLELPGCGVLTAAKLLGETAGAARFADDAKLAMHAGAAPLPASSGARQRHRLNRSGNRQLNCALHRMAITQGRWHPPAKEYLARKEREGHSRKEALRCLKRHLACVVYRTLRAAEEEKMTSTNRPALVPALT